MSGKWPSTTVMAAVAIAALVADAVKSLCKSLPDITDAKSRRETARVSALSAAHASLMRAQLQADFVRAAALRQKPGSGPRTPGGGPQRPGGGRASPSGGPASPSDNVVPLRPSGAHPHDA
jgi:hypothetical protein